MAEKRVKVLFADKNSLPVLIAERILRSANFQWQTKDGTRIYLKDITDTHLDNIIKMLQRMQDNYSTMLEIGATEEDIY